MNTRLPIHYLIVLMFTLILDSMSYGGGSYMFDRQECKGAYLYHFLNRASYFGDVIGVRILLNQGADPNGKGYERYPDCVAPIEYSSPLHRASSGNHIEVARLLLEAGADPNILEGEGETPLVEAVRKQNVELVKLLLEFGAKVDMKGLSYKPVKIAEKTGNSKIIQLLKEAH